MVHQKYQYVDWDTLYHLCSQIYETIRADSFKPDLIVGIARGGWVPARILADNHLQSRKVADLRTACLHVKPWTKQLPNYYAESTDVWVIYPWELKEFIFDFAQQLAKEKKSGKEIEKLLLEIGLPATPTKLFLTEWVG